MASTAIIAIGLAACTSSTGLLRARFSKEHTCPEDQVSVTEAGGTNYIAKGCNQTTEYVCTSFGGGPGTAYTNCVEQGLDLGAPNAPEQPRFVKPIEGPSTVPPPK
jgi:hypothetical protein